MEKDICYSSCKMPHVPCIIKLGDFLARPAALEQGALCKLKKKTREGEDIFHYESGEILKGVALRGGIYPSLKVFNG